MDIGRLYWLLVILWIVSLLGSYWGPEPYRAYTAIGNNVFHADPVHPAWLAGVRPDASSERACLGTFHTITAFTATAAASACATEATTAPAG
jgi:hypothetical protein